VSAGRGRVEHGDELGRVATDSLGGVHCDDDRERPGGEEGDESSPELERSLTLLLGWTVWSGTKHNRSSASVGLGVSFGRVSSSSSECTWVSAFSA
jgi:hypothetical protein